MVMPRAERVGSSSSQWNMCDLQPLETSTSWGILVWEDPPTHHLVVLRSWTLGRPYILMSLSHLSASWISTVTTSVETSRSPEISMEEPGS